jgi:hypothetical protein
MLHHNTGCCLYDDFSDCVKHTAANVTEKEERGLVICFVDTPRPQIAAAAAAVQATDVSYCRSYLVHRGDFSYIDLVHRCVGCVPQMACLAIDAHLPSAHVCLKFSRGAPKQQ